MGEAAPVKETPIQEREEQQDTGGPRGPRIRCPICDWMPTPADLWTCACSYQWHTFDTGGVCPACLHQWKTTQCPRCLGWSAHTAWYEYA